MVDTCDEGVLCKVVDLVAEDLLLEWILRLELDASRGCDDFSACSLRY